MKGQSKSSWVFMVCAIILSLGGSMSCVQPPAPDASVAGNRNPVIRSLTADPAAINVGTSSNITVDATDPDNNPLT